MHKIKRIACALSFLFLNLFAVTSCNNDNGVLKAGDDYKTMWAYFEEKGIKPMQCKDYVIFEENQRVHVIRRSDDYRTIKEIRDFPTRTLTEENYEFSASGMNVYQVIEYFGMPEAVYSSSAQFVFPCEGHYSRALLFFCDDLHIYYVL